MLPNLRKRPMVEEIPNEETSTSGESQSDSGVRQIGIVRGKDGLSRLVELQLEELETLGKKIELWTKYRDDYQKLKQLIDKMQDKVQHPHRIPIAGSRLAFVDGHIIHTNELHVLLGDNYFALRSARQSEQIIDRRLDDIRRKLGAAEEARKKTQGWLDASQGHKRDKEEFVEIIETM